MDEAPLLPHSANRACEGPFLQQERWMIVRRASAAPGPAPSYEGDDRTDQDHNSGGHREDSNPLPDPALFSFIRRHVTSLMFFSASCRSQIPLATYPLTAAGPAVLSLQSATTPPSGRSRH